MFVANETMALYCIVLNEDERSLVIEEVSAVVSDDDEDVWSSEYGGSDATVSKALQHIGSKRDPTTKTKEQQQHEGHLKKLLQEYPSLRKRYWGGHFWGSGYGAWSTGEITDELVNDYLEHHRSRERPNDAGDFILE